jgi:hypothetical protein
MGIVLRSQLAVLLKSRRCFQPTSFVSEVSGVAGAGAWFAWDLGAERGVCSRRPACHRGLTYGQIQHGTSRTVWQPAMVFIRSLRPN